MRLYKAFILPHFITTQLSGISVTLEIQKNILRFIFKDANSDYKQFLKKAGITNLGNRRLQLRHGTDYF